MMLFEIKLKDIRKDRTCYLVVYSYGQLDECLRNLKVAGVKLLAGEDRSADAYVIDARNREASQ